MIIGMLPMALGMGEGGEQNAPLGRAVIGGLVLATVATPGLFRRTSRARAGADAARGTRRRCIHGDLRCPEPTTPRKSEGKAFFRPTRPPWRPSRGGGWLVGSAGLAIVAVALGGLI